MRRARRSGAAGSPETRDPRRGTRLQRLLYADPPPWARLALVGAAVFLVTLLGLVQVATAARFAFSLLLLVPTALLAWYLGWRWGGAMVALSVGVWLWAELHAGVAGASIALANAAVRTVVFSLTAFAFASLREAHRSLNELADFDALTGLANRRLLATVLERERKRAARYGKPLTVLYLDLDNFKPVNDRFGHKAGDGVLVEVAAALENAVRSSDFPARVGGDEFAIVLPECGKAQVGSVVANLRTEWARLDAWKQHRVDVSIGAVTFERVPLSSEAMLSEADALMYRAKEGGKGETSYAVVAA